MNKEQLLTKLHNLAQDRSDIEANHLTADALLLEFINDPEIEEAYEKIDKWYA